MKRGFRRRLVLAAAAGLVLGALAGAAEALRAEQLSHGVPGVVFAYAAIIDGFLGLLAGLVAGTVWATAARLVQRRHARRRAIIVARRRPVVVVRRRGTGPVEVTRRSFLRITASGAALAGGLGAGALAWQATQRRSSGAIPEALAESTMTPTSSSAAGPAASAAGIARPPNVLLVTIDTLRADQLGAYGNSFVKTPNLDAFAAQSARFDWHMVQQPQTNPSHASMFTGMYPSSSGVRVHMVDKIPDQLATLAKQFSAAGYSTAGLFSWMSFDNQYCNFQPGFQVYQDLTSAGSSLLDAPGVKDLVAQYRVAAQYLSVPQAVDQATGAKEQQEAAGKGHADVTTNAAIAQLGQFGNRPFFMWLHYFDPHYPYQPPGQYATMYDPSYQGSIDDSMATIDAITAGKLQLQPPDVQRLMSFYQGEISFLDGQIVKLFQALDSMGLSQNTVVAVTGDHGDSFGEHLKFDEDGGFFHPHTLFNTEQRVPLLIRYPDKIRAGASASAPTQAIDIFPTLLTAAGLPVPDQAQGKNVLALLDGSDDGTARASFAAMPDYVFTSITAPGWKLIRNVPGNQVALFDLTHDPGEQQDVSAAQPQEASQLAAQLNGWMKQVKIS